MASESIDSERVRSRQNRGSLQRPRLGPNLVQRPRLVEQLAAATSVPVTLVVAPAGYGKTTAVLEWLSGEPAHSAWLSVDETDDDLRTMVIHIVSAIQAIAPGVGARTIALLDMQSPTTARSLGATLADDCLDLEWDLVLVLDDLHFVSNPEIGEFFDGLLRHPAPLLHIVVTSRDTPRLPLPSLRARDQVLEVRAADLRFTAGEISALCEQVGGAPPSLATVSRIQDLTQGWVACIRLAALAPGALSEAPDPLVSRHLTDFLVEEVLARQPRDVQEFLLRTSIVVEINAPLASALLDGAVADIDAQRRLESLVAGGLLTTPIGHDRVWFRYHPIFRDLLQERLIASVDADEVRRLHLVASAWLAANGRTEAAVAAALQAGDRECAASIVALAGFNAVDTEAWSDLGGLLTLLPASDIDNRADLLILRCWANYHLDNLAALPADLERATLRLDALPASAPRPADVLRGHILAFQPYTAAEYSDLASTLDLAERALALLPVSDAVPRGLVLGQVGRRFTVEGDPDGGVTFLTPYTEFTDLRHAGSAARALAALVGVHITGRGDYDAAERPLRQILALGKTVPLPILTAFATSTLGWIALRRLDPRQAIPLFESVISRTPAPTLITWRAAMYGLALSRFALGRPGDAHATAAKVVAFCATAGNPLVLENARSFQAHLWLLHGDLDRAAAWVESIAANPDFEAPFHQESIALTRARVLLALGDSASIERARAQLARCQETGGTLHIQPFIHQTNLVQALLEDACGHRATALRILGDALQHVADQRNHLSVVELGMPMVELLRALPAANRHADLAAHLATMIDTSTWAPQPIERAVVDRPADTSGAIVLTTRELQVLQLLQQRMSNKEIASALSISPLTVKRHSAAIFQKFGVGRRREAVSRAIELGILRRI